MQRLILFLILIFAATSTSAHNFKVFATIEDGDVTGYAFFVGGGRPHGAIIIIQDTASNELYRGTTDDAGIFSWRPAQPADLTVVANAGDGHVATTRISRERFPSASSTSVEITHNAAAPPNTVLSSEKQTTGTAACVPEDIEQLVGEAVARQVQPLLEAYAQAEDRTKLTDVVGGIGMIFGLAGIAMWAFSRRRVNDSTR